MKVFIIKPRHGYCGGCALIAADTMIGAIDTYINTCDYNADIFVETNCSCEELKDVIYNKYIDKPCIIIDTIYIE